MANNIHQEIDYDETPDRLYGILLSSQSFGEFTGAPAEIDASVSGR